MLGGAAPPRCPPLGNVPNVGPPPGINASTAQPYSTGWPAQVMRLVSAVISSSSSRLPATSASAGMGGAGGRDGEASITSPRGSRNTGASAVPSTEKPPSCTRPWCHEQVEMMFFRFVSPPLAQCSMWWACRCRVWLQPGNRHVESRSRSARASGSVTRRRLRPTSSTWPCSSFTTSTTWASHPSRLDVSAETVLLVELPLRLILLLVAGMSTVVTHHPLDVARPFRPCPSPTARVHYPHGRCASWPAPCCS